MMAMTTSNSINVNAMRRRVRVRQTTGLAWYSRPDCGDE